MPRAEPAAARVRRCAAALPVAVTAPVGPERCGAARRPQTRPTAAVARTSAPQRPAAPCARSARPGAASRCGARTYSWRAPPWRPRAAAGGGCPPCGRPRSTGRDARCGMRRRRSTTTRAARGGGRARPPGPAPPGRAVMSARTGRGAGGRC